MTVIRPGWGVTRTRWGDRRTGQATYIPPQLSRATAQLARLCDEPPRGRWATDGDVDVGGWIVKGVVERAVVLILILLLPLCNLLGPLVAVRLYVGEDQTEGHTR